MSFRINEGEREEKRRESLGFRINEGERERRRKRKREKARSIFLLKTHP